MRTIEQAKHWIDEQRAKLGNPRITSVQAYLGDSMETVAIYAEVENQVEINGDLPLVAGFDLPAPITEKQFELMRETIEQQFASAYVRFTPRKRTFACIGDCVYSGKRAEFSGGSMANDKMIS